ncbi:MAG: acyltransferase [Desulfobacteraceae bacterium]|nr:acyltransferase [Desulfobacteraceae bacterium]
MNQRIEYYTKLVEKYKFLFSWVKLFYPKSKGIPIFYLLYFFFPQKILRINGRVPWPVHFTSRVLYYKNVSVGNRSAPGMNACCYIQARNSIKIGHNLRMGPGVGLISSNHNLNNYDTHTHDAPIRIGNNVWIGMNSVILPGVIIGNNVMIGANSVVTDEVGSNLIVAGNPLRIIREKEPYEGNTYET